MKFLSLITMILLLIGAIVIIFQNKNLKELIKIVMENQAEFDAKITAANEALDAIGAAITAEAAQVSEFIAGLPASVDTSALDGVVSRLGGVAASVSDVFTPPAA